jgi:hypothetical protein
VLLLGAQQQALMNPRAGVEKASKLVTLLNCEDRKGQRKLKLRILINVFIIFGRRNMSTHILMC